MPNLHILDHPLIQSKLTRLRDVSTSNHSFRLLLEELTAFMVYEITRDYPLREVEVKTPFEQTVGKILDVPVVLVPILRAGTGMLGGVLDLIPTAKVGHIGIYRDAGSLQPVEYYAKLPPELPESQVVLVDPMLATGGSAVVAADVIKREGGTMIQFLCLVASPEGVEVFSRAHPDVPIYTAALDRQLLPYCFGRRSTIQFGRRFNVPCRYANSLSHVSRPCGTAYYTIARWLSLAARHDTHSTKLTCPKTVI